MYTEAQKFKLGQCDALMGRPCTSEYNTHADKPDASNYMRGFLYGQADIAGMIAAGTPHVVIFPRIANDR